MLCYTIVVFQFKKLFTEFARFYNKTQFFFFFIGFFGHNTALIASSKTCLSPFCVRAEHSRYFTAFISLAMLRALGVAIGANFFSFNFSIVSLSSRKSSLVPTSTTGAFGQWWLTSGNHLARTFSNEAGLVNEKQIRKTSWKRKKSLKLSVD